MLAYVFPGQGSQTAGMGSQLFKEFPDMVQKANQILGYSISDLCLQDGKNLDNTRFTQPALYVVSAFTYLKKIRQAGKNPDYVAGHSLGEYSALFAAEVFDFETGLQIVQKRGELMNEAGGGSMAAVIGLKSGEIISLLHENHLKNVGIANFNSHNQSVISGEKNNVDSAKSFFEKAGAMFVPLKVSGAFHSLYMKPAQKKFADFIRQFTFRSPAMPVISNVNARPYQPECVFTYLVDQMTNPVQWTQSIEYLTEKGEAVFEEIGPGNVLTGLIRRIQNGQ